MAAAARRMLPGAEILAGVIGTTGSAAAIRDAIAGLDLIVTQVSPTHLDEGTLSAQALQGHAEAVLFIPPAVFTGFHPDMIYVDGPGGSVPAAHGPYHSQIAVAAFTLGLDAERAVRLFNAHVFHRLGYFDSYGAASAHVGQIFKRAGFPMARALREWRHSRTVFMHTINHPTIALNWRMAAFALSKADLADAFTPLDPTAPDDLAQRVVMPVLPAIARRIGVAGGDTMLRNIGEIGSDPRALPYADFVRRSFDVYRDTDPAVFSLPPQVAFAERLRAVLA